VYVDNITWGILQFVVMLAVNKTRRDPWKKLRDSPRMIRFGFGKLFASDLHVEILCAGQPQGCW